LSSSILKPGFGSRTNQKPRTSQHWFKVETQWCAGETPAGRPLPISLTWGDACQVRPAVLLGKKNKLRNALRTKATRPKNPSS